MSSAAFAVFCAAVAWSAAGFKSSTVFCCALTFSWAAFSFTTAVFSASLATSVLSCALSTSSLALSKAALSSLTLSVAAGISFFAWSEASKSFWADASTSFASLRTVVASSTFFVASATSPCALSWVALASFKDSVADSFVRPWFSVCVAASALFVVSVASVVASFWPGATSVVCASVLVVTVSALAAWPPANVKPVANKTDANPTFNFTRPYLRVLSALRSAIIFLLFLENI